MNGPDEQARATNVRAVELMMELEQLLEQRRKSPASPFARTGKSAMEDLRAALRRYRSSD
jgi:hypothetical protein